jgi:hypothetical protein
MRQLVGPLRVSFNRRCYLKQPREDEMNGWTLAIVVALGLSGVARTAMAQQEDPIAVIVQVSNQAGVSRDVLTHAYAEATRAYSKIGINVIWCESATAESAFTIRIVSDAPDGVRDGRQLGVVPGTKPGRKLAYAFYGRISKLAQSSGTDASALLGHVIAHELGHLLLGHGSHGLSGLMTGRWDDLQLQLVTMGELSFTRDQGKAMRGRLERDR